MLTIENLDSRAVGPIYEAVKDWEEPVAIAVLPDHPTPCELRFDRRGKRCRQIHAHALHCRALEAQKR